MLPTTFTIDMVIKSYIYVHSYNRKNKVTENLHYKLKRLREEDIRV